MAKPALGAAASGAAGGALSAIGLYREVLHWLRQDWQHLLAYGLIVKLCQLTAAGPLAGAFLQGLADWAGLPALSNVQIQAFILSPLGPVILLALIALLVLLLLFESSGYVAIGLGRSLGQRVTFEDALAIQLRRSHALLYLGLALASLVLAVSIVLLLLAGLTYRLLLSEHDINHYLAARPEEFQQALTIGIVLVLVLAICIVLVYVLAIFALPSCLLTGGRPRANLAWGLRLFRRNRPLVLSALAFWWIFNLLLIVFVNGLIFSGGSTLLSQFGDRPALIAAGGGLTVAVATLAGTLGSFMTLAGHGLLVARLYHHLEGDRAAADRPKQDAAWLDLSRSDVVAAFGRSRVTRLSAVSLAIVFVISSGLATAGLTERIDMQDGVDIIAHRGSSAELPENTLPAVERAIQEGSDWVEIDVQLSADGTPIVLHDKDLNRVARLDLEVSQASDAQLAALDVGLWRGEAFQGTRIPSLADVLTAMHGADEPAGPLGARLLIELKYHGFDPDLVPRVVQVLEAHAATAGQASASRLALMSLEHRAIAQLRRLAPELQAGLVVSASIGRIERLDVDFLALSRRLAQEARVLEAKAAGKQVYVWTVDDPAEMSKFVERGVNGIITNRPALLARVLAERAELSDTERLLLRVGHALD